MQLVLNRIPFWKSNLKASRCIAFVRVGKVLMVLIRFQLFSIPEMTFRNYWRTYFHLHSLQARSLKTSTKPRNTLTLLKLLPWKIPRNFNFILVSADIYNYPAPRSIKLCCSKQRLPKPLEEGTTVKERRKQCKKVEVEDKNGVNPRWSQSQIWFLNI